MRINWCAKLPLACTLLAFVATSASGGPQADLESAARAGRANAERLPSISAEWSTDIGLPNGSVETVTTLHTPPATRYVVTVSLGKDSQELARIIETGGLWYVQDEHGRAKYRAYEYPSDNVLPYVGLVRSTPTFVTPEVLPRLGTVSAQDARSATFNAPLPENVAGMARQFIRQLQNLKRDHPEAPPPASMTKQVDDMQELLRHGVVTVVDLSTGLVTENRSLKLPTTTHGFRFVNRVDAGAFEVNGKWNDLSSDPTRGNKDDLLMIGHCASYRLGMPTPDSDCMLVDSGTGRFRRVPFRGVLSMPGCFLPGRTKVVVSGADTMSGTIRPFIVDLKTGQNQPVGGDVLNGGATIGGSVSPDGIHLACTHMTGSVLECEVVVVDLRTGQARRIGKPMDVGPVHWSADGRLVLLRRESREMNKPSDCYVSVMDLDGHVTDLRRGDQAIPLDDKRILFEDEKTRLWHTCDYSGGNEALLADGLPACGFPAPSADGARILMMKFQPGALPVPTIIPVGQSRGTPLSDAPGLWDFPAWR